MGECTSDKLDEKARDALAKMLVDSHQAILKAQRDVGLCPTCAFRMCFATVLQLAEAHKLAKIDIIGCFAEAVEQALGLSLVIGIDASDEHVLHNFVGRKLH